MAPARNSDSNCDFVFQSGNQKKKFNYDYYAAHTTSITVTATANPFEFEIVENNFTDHNFNIAEFVLLDGSLESTSSVYEMTITKVNNTVATVVPTGGVLPAGKFLVRAETNYGFALPTTPYT